MASLTGSRILFFTTSPRTPTKMIPEIKLLADFFEGLPWTKSNQVQYMEQLIQEEDGFQGQGRKTDLAFSARDRITRAPKALGFVNLHPFIHVTDAGMDLINEKRTEEIFLRQLLKFQLPSPYHTASKVEQNIFWVRPYLEIMRLVHNFGSITFDEVMFFGLQLTHYERFDEIVDKIEAFRLEKEHYSGRYKQLREEISNEVVRSIYGIDINSGRIGTRESNDVSLDKFIKTKLSNMRDYTDACFRYLRATGLFDISQKGRSLSVVQEKVNDLAYILRTVKRKPIFTDHIEDYKNYLFDPAIPVLYTDNKQNLIEQIVSSGFKDAQAVQTYSLNELKTILADGLEKNKQAIIEKYTKSIKNYDKFDSIMSTFKDITNKNLYDIPLMLEWNTWRAMTMIDGGSITANLKFDDRGEPMSTAQGNMADIQCMYDDFGLTVEVTMSSGQRQYETEGEPVSRHLAKYKHEINKDAFCLFIAPNINEACISHFYMLHKTNIFYYGGKSVIVPIQLSTFEKMVVDSHEAGYIPNSQNLKALFEFSIQCAESSVNEQEWYQKVTDRALNWLNNT